MNNFFTQDVYETEIGLDVNEDVLKRIYDDEIKDTDMLPIEFFYVTDEKQKANNLKNYLVKNFSDYSQIQIQDIDSLYEISGLTTPIPMELEKVNAWNQSMWDLGYKFDCKLDGWQVQV